MGNERERQLQGKLLKAKEELKFEREEVCSLSPFKSNFFFALALSYIVL